jgi:hypothetical protein
MSPPATAALSAAPNSSGKKRKAVAADARAEQEHQQNPSAYLPQPAPQPVLPDIEIQRLQRIERNKLVMQQMGVTDAAAAVKQSMSSSKRQKTAAKKKVRLQTECALQRAVLPPNHIRSPCVNTPSVLPRISAVPWQTTLRQ